MRTGLRAALVGALVASLAACGGNSSGGGNTGGGGATGGDLKIGTFVEPASFDPATAQEGNPIPYYQAVYDTLIKRDPDGSLSPMLAESWKYNSDNTQLTLDLRDDVKFTDGSTFDSSVVKANIDHFKEANGPQAGSAAQIASVDTPDAQTAVINLEQPDPALEVALTNALGFMASPKAVGSDGLKSTPVGSGPYTLDKDNTVVGSQYTFVRNKDYWGDELPYDTVSFMVLPDETARLNALQSGQVNTAVFASARSGDQVKAAGLQLLSQNGDWGGLIFFDRTGAMVPALADVRVREALAYAIDKKALFEQVALGRGEVTTQIFGESTLGYDKSLDEDRWAYNPDKARQLLKDAGYGSGLTLDLPVSPVFDPAIATTMIQNWQDVGITVTRKDFGPGETIPALTGGKYPLAFFTLVMPNDWRTIQAEVLPTGTWNPLHTEDPKVTELTQKIQVATDDATREPLLEELNQYLVDQAWFAPFYRIGSNIGADKDTKVELQAEQAVPSIYNYSPAS